MEENMRSNIKIASNIYVRITDKDKIEKDKDFIHNISGKKFLNEIKPKISGTLSPVKFTNYQEKELENRNTCSLDKLGEKTHGKVRNENNKIVRSCRCENIDCSGYETCMKDQYALKIIRDKVEIPDDAPVINAEKSRLKYGNLFDYNKITVDEINDNIAALHKDSDEYDNIPTKMYANEKIEYFNNDGFEIIENQNAIIESDINQNILVNAGPGTGKTHTIIKRLEYIIKNNLVEDFSNVLVLVYTRAAKKVIYDRLNDGVINGTLPIEARNILLYTFDSFGTEYLDVLENGENITNKNTYKNLHYDERIKLFTKSVNPEHFELFEYLIVDEIQDLVDLRGKMVLKLLEVIRCSYLLCGDKCQSIFDHDKKHVDSLDVMKSTLFYSELNNILPENTKKYELLGNKRQDENLAIQSDEIRNYLLNGNMSNDEELGDYLLSIFKTKCLLDNFKNKSQEHIKNNKKIAILTRTNGEAESISSYFRENKIEHLLVRDSINNSVNYHRFISDILWDYHKPYIIKDDFIKRYLARVSNDEKQANEIWKELFELTTSNNSENQDSMLIEKSKLVNALATNSISSDIENSILVNPTTQNIIISTIHKSKGKEFDVVYLYEKPSRFEKKSDEEISDEKLKVLYVGITRAKSEVHMLNSSIRNKFASKDNRGYQYYSKRSKNQDTVQSCTNIAMGLSGDIKVNSFVYGDFKKTLEIQKYIADNVKINDKLSLHLDSNSNYNIIHNNIILGQLSNSAFNGIHNCVSLGWKSKTMPTIMSEIYISDIVTEYESNADDKIPEQFRKTKFWLGVRISGFGKLRAWKEVF